MYWQLAVSPTRERRRRSPKTRSGSRRPISASDEIRDVSPCLAVARGRTLRGMTTCHDVYDQDFRPRQLVVGVDDSPGSRAALGWALDQARSSNAQVVAINVVAPVIPLDFAGAGFYTTSAVDSRAVRRAAQDLLDRTVREVANGRSNEVRTRVLEGNNPGQVLVRGAREGSRLGG